MLMHCFGSCGGRFNARWVLIVLGLVGCEEIGLTPKSDPAPAMEQTAAPVAAPPASDLSNLPSFGSGGVAAKTATTPEEFVASFKTKPGHEISDADLLKLAETIPLNSEITELSLKGARITKDGLAQFGRLPGLLRLDLTGCGVPGEDWAGLSTATQLEELILEGSAISDTSIAAITPLVNLRKLNISRTTVTDQGFNHLTKLSRLEHINCGGNQITGAGFEAFTAKYAKAPLKEIYVTNTGFGTYGFEHLDGINSIEVLAAGEAGVTDPALKSIRGCKNMRVLYLGKNPVSDQGLKILSGMDALEDLDVTGCNLVSNFTLEKIKNHKSLKNLGAASTACNLAGIQELKKYLPSCVIVFNGMKY